MTEVVLSEGLIARLSNCGPQVHIFAEDGTEVGWFRVCPSRVEQLDMNGPELDLGEDAMPHVVFDDETVSRLRAEGYQSWIESADGHQLGWFRFGRSYLFESWMTEEEIQERLSGPTRTLTQILADLRAKYGD